MLRRIVPFVALGLAVLGLSQTPDTLTVAFGQAGERRVWVAPHESTAIPEDAVTVTGELVELPIAELQEAESVFVLDVPRRAVAVMRGREALQRGTWNVTPEQFKLLQELAVEVTHTGLPLAAGVVELTIGEDVRRTLLSPEDRGVARFGLVPAGEVRVQVEYESEGQMRKTALQSFTLSVDEETNRQVGVVITDPVETIGAAPTAPARGEAAEPVAPEPAPVRRQGLAQTLIGMLVSVALLAGLVYGIVLLIRKNPQVLKDTLDKAGVITGSAPADPPAPVAQAPEPMKPILLGDPPMAAAAAPQATPNPRLVREDGSVVLLPEGETLLGREPGRHFESESTVSRRHAVVVCSGKQVTVRDEGSSNGTYVNGSRITGETQLFPGDQVQIGAVKLRYEV